MQMHKRTLIATLLAAAGLTLVAGVGAAAGKRLVIGFAQTGAESEWRTANTDSVKSAAKAADVELKFSDAQQKQENQVKAIRSFIAQKVDVIILAPLVTTGWDTVLKEAKAAKIPVILESRNVEVKDTTTWASFVGSDFVEEGRRAGRWLLDHTKGTAGDINIVELQGTVGSDPANNRKKGFEEVIKAKAGLKPGKDILVIGVDAVKGAFEAMLAGKMNVSVECSPLLGPQLMDAARKAAAGETLPRWIKTNEGVFPQEVAAKEFPNRKY